LTKTIAHHTIFLSMPPFLIRMEKAKRVKAAQNGVGGMLTAAAEQGEGK